MHKDIDMMREYRAAVICIGGAGCNIAGQLMDRLCRADIVAVNTDSIFAGVEADYKFVLPAAEGGDISAAAESVRASESDLRAFIRNYNFIYIVSAMGGCTGTGIAPEIAALCALEKIPCTAMAVMPFSFEDRQLTALEGFRNLHAQCNDAVRFDNDSILSKEDLSFADAMDYANDLICDSIEETINELPIIRRRVPPADADAMVGMGCRIATS